MVWGSGLEAEVEVEFGLMRAQPEILSPKPVLKLLTYRSPRPELRKPKPPHAMTGKVANGQKFTGETYRKRHRGRSAPGLRL